MMKGGPTGRKIHLHDINVLLADPGPLGGIQHVPEIVSLGEEVLPLVVSITGPILLVIVIAVSSGSG